MDFCSTIIIMTSNIDRHLLFENTMPEDAMWTKIQNELCKVFLSEFLNRVDNIILFSKITQNSLQKKLNLQNSSIDFSGGVSNYLLKKDYNTKFVSRYLRRTLQKYLENPLAAKIFEGYFPSNDTIKINKHEDKLIMEKQG